MEPIFQRIVVGVDGSPPSLAAVGLATRLAGAYGGRLYFCHADPAHDGRGTEGHRELERAGQEILKAAVAAASAAGASASGTTIDAPPVLGIVNYAGEVDADAIVVGTHGRPTNERFLFGSVSDAVVRLAQVPVIVAPPPAEGDAEAFKRVFVAIDNSDASDGAIAFATHIAAAQGSRLTFCHVIDEDTLYEDAAANYEGRTYPVLHEWQVAANVLAGRAIDQARGAGVVEVDTMILTGDPCEQLVNAARSCRADLIVIGAFGRNGVRLLAVGSLTEAVLRRAEIPVAVIRPLSAANTALEGHVKEHGYLTLEAES